MRTFARSLIGLCCLCFLHATSAEARRVALVVGIDKYDNLGRDQNLQKAGNDAIAMSAAFRDLGYQVTTLTDATLVEFNRAWNDLQKKLEPDDTVAMFFAGHGIEMDGTNYLLPRDVPKAGPGDSSLLRTNSIRFAQLTEDLQRHNVGVAIFILDACRDNPFRDNRGRSVGIGGRGLTIDPAPRGSFVMYSAGQNQTALDRLSQNDSDPNSVYTRNLLPLLREPGLSLPALAKTIQTKVSALAKSINYNQFPAYYDNMNGDFSFRPLEDPATAVKPGTGQSFVDTLVSRSRCSFCPTLVVAPAGEFSMGSPADEPNRYPGQREAQMPVKIERPFAVGKYAITFDEWDACVADGGCNGYRPLDHGLGRGQRPVVNVNWRDATGFVGWLSQKTGKSYRLLSESEREYVARAGTTAPYWWGTAASPTQANFASSSIDLDAPTGLLAAFRNIVAGGAKGGARRGALPVDSLRANDWGLHHVHGNVWEWTEDCWNEANGGNPGDGSRRSAGDCNRRVLRGGAWDVPAAALRSANRFSAPLETREASVGFRVARSIGP